FLGKEIPAVGVSGGVDSVLALMLEKNIAADLQPTRVLVMNWGAEFASRSLTVLRQLRAAGVSAEYFYDAKDLDKQFKYAEGLGIAYGILIGDEEAKSNKLTLRDLVKREQKTLSLEELIKEID